MAQWQAIHMIETKNLVKSFKNGDVETQVLKGIDFRVENGAFVAIMGRSGAGKSTFLYQMSLLDEPTSALDPLQVIEIRNLILSLSGERTVLLCTHILSEAAAVCRRVMILNRGNIVADKEMVPGDTDLEKTFTKVVLG